MDERVTSIESNGSRADKAFIAPIVNEDTGMTNPDFSRHSFHTPSASPVLPWWAQLFALPGHLVSRRVERPHRRGASDPLVPLSDRELNDLGLEKGPYEAGRHCDPAILRAQRWLSTLPH